MRGWIRKTSEERVRSRDVTILRIAIIMEVSLLLTDLSMDQRKGMDFSGTSPGPTVVVGWISGGRGRERLRGYLNLVDAKRLRVTRASYWKMHGATREFAIDRSQMQVPTGRRMVLFFSLSYFFFFSPFNRWHSVSGICDVGLSCCGLEIMRRTPTTGCTSLSLPFSSQASYIQPSSSPCICSIFFFC